MTSRLFGAFALVWSRSGRALAPPSSWPATLAAGVESFDYGDAGRTTFAVAGGERARDERRLVVKLGGLRDAAGGRLSAADILRRDLVAADAVAAEKLTGNGLAIALDPRAPRFAAYGTLLALPQLHYAFTADGFAAASEPRLLLPLLDRVEIDEEAVPAHFLFRFVPGRRTYFRGVSRLYPGELLRFDGGRIELRRRRRLRDLEASVPRFDGIDDAGVEWLDRTMSDTTAAWVSEAEAAALPVGNLLSGGLDSSLAQVWLNDLGPRVQRRSWSFTVDAPSFAFEERYAREASALLGTEHRFATVREAEYPGLFDAALDALAEPTLYNEGWACQLAVAEFLKGDAGGARVVFAGNAADALHGIGDLKAIRLWRQLTARPRRLERLRRGLPQLRARLRSRPETLAWIEALEMSDDPATFLDPSSYVSIAGELAYAVPAFGEAAVFRAFEERRALETELFGGDELFETMQMLDVVSAGYDPTLAVVRLFGAQGIDVVQLYLDEAAIAAPFAFPRELRYLRPRGPWRRRLKPLQQELLERRGYGALVGRKKGGTNFNDDLWRWLSEGCLRERVEAIERPAWLDAAALADMKTHWNDFLWNLLVYDGWRRRVVEPAARAARERAA
jgi:hypothetical protein